MRRPKVKIGDTIRFKSATRSHYKLATRKVVGIDHMGRPEVRYHGWANFVVFPQEIVEVVR